jgi:hypothetical protein
MSKEHEDSLLIARCLADANKRLRAIEDAMKKGGFATHLDVHRMEERMVRLARDVGKLGSQLESEDATRHAFAKRATDLREEFSAKMAELGRAIDAKTFEAAKGFNPRGEWEQGMTLNRFDVVTVGGSSYLVLKDGVTEKPNSRSKTLFQLIARRGGGGGGGGALDSLKIENNLSDVANVATARTNLGLGNVDNTSDANKPVSTATQTALNAKAPIASPSFTGPVETSGNITTTGGDLRAPNGSILADGITLTNGTDILDILRSNTGSRELQLPADLDAKAPADSPTFTTIATLPSPTRVGTSTSGTIGGAGQGGGYSYTPALTVSGGAIISSANGETLIKNTISGLVHSSSTLCRNNVLAIQNTGTTNTARPLPSAIRFLDPDGGERGAIGWSHDTVWAPFARTLFFSASQPYTEGYTPAAPPRMRFLQEGLYLGTERFAGRLEFDTDWTTRFLTPLEAAILTLTPAGAATFANTLLVSGILSAGTTPTTLTDAAGKILSAALNTVAVAQGGLGITTTPANGALPIGNGTGYTSATITGTANQVTVTNGAGTITLSTPQSIATSSSPSFAGLSVTQAAAMASMTITGLNTGTNLNAGADSGAQLTLRNSSTGANVFSRLAFQDAGFSNVAAINGVSVNDTTNEGALVFSTRASGGSIATALTLAGSGAATFVSDVEVTDNTKGVILKSPNGTRWRMTVSDAGVLGATSL